VNTASDPSSANQPKPALPVSLRNWTRNKFALFSLALVLVAWQIALNFQDSHRITIRVGGFETGRYLDETLLTALVTISNTTPHAMEFDVTHQIRAPSGWSRPDTITTWYLDPDNGTRPLLPFSAREIRVPIPAQTQGPWRIVLRSHDPQISRLHTYLSTLQGRAEFHVSTEQPATKSKTTPSPP
jgi:hypothetical protein